MQFEMNPKIGTDYSTVNFKPHSVKGMALIYIINVFHTLGGEMINDVSHWKFPSFITAQVIKEVIRNTCFECGGLMKDGQAIKNNKITVESYDSAVNTYQGTIEYPDPNNHSLIKVRKCTVCGHSHT